MKKLLWALLAALPMQAAANEGDPIAYKCYYCTPAEMEDVALAQGVGQHYVYDAEKLTITGFRVFMQNGTLKADPFEAEGWVRTQFLGMMSLYNPSYGDMIGGVGPVALLAPGTEHGRSSRYLWGHDLIALNGHHEKARETVRRYVTEHPTFDFLDTSHSGGKLLRFEYMLDDSQPIIATMHFQGKSESRARYYFDHSARLWRYLGSYLPQQHFHQAIQESRDDFAPSQGVTTYYYPSRHAEWAEAFIERATWAGIPVHGDLANYHNVRFDCERVIDDIQCQMGIH